MVNPALLERALTAIKKGTANYEYFFQHLDDPNWIPDLRKHGYFQNPPRAERKRIVDRGPEREVISFPFWPESQCLLKMAKKGVNPQRVFKTAWDIEETENVRVREDIIDVAIHLPPAMAAKLASKALQWIKDPLYLLLPEKLGQLSTKLATEGQHIASLRLAKALLEVLPDPEEINPKKEWVFPPNPIARFELWEYQKILGSLAPTLIQSTKWQSLNLICELLSDAVRFSRNPNARNSTEDSSYAWRPSINSHDEDHPYGLPDLLVSAVRDAAYQITNNDVKDLPRVLAALKKYRWNVFQRISISLLCKFPNNSKGLFRRYLLHKDTMRFVGIVEDYSVFAEVFFARLNTQEKRKFLKGLEAVSQQSAQRNRQTTALQSTSMGSEIKVEATRQLIRRMMPVRRFLSPKQQTDLELLISDFEKSLPASRSKLPSVNPIENRLLPIDDIQAWPPNRQIDYLVRSQSVNLQEVLIRLRDLIPKDPQEYAKQAALIKGFDPAGVRIFFQVLDEFVQKLALDWDSILDLAEWAVLPERDIEHKTRGNKVGGDQDWTKARQAIARLIGGCLKEGSLEVETRLRSKIWEVLRQLIVDPDPTPSDEARLLAGNWDPTTLSNNTTRGEAMHALMRFALWVHRHNNKAEKGSEETPEAFGTLSSRLSPLTEPSVGVRSVYGQWLPWLVMLDPEWTKLKEDQLFPAQREHAKLRRTTWNAYLANPPYGPAFEVLHDEYIRAVDRFCKASKQPMDDSDHALGTHLLTFYLWGKIELRSSSSLLEKFLATAPDSLRRQIGWSFGRSLKTEAASTSTPISPEIKKRLKSFWMSRIKRARKHPESFSKELGAFGLWFISGQFENRWSLMRLKETVQIAQRIEPRSEVIDRLAILANRHPLQVLDCLDAISLIKEEGLGLVAAEKAIHSIIEATATHKNSTVREKATVLAHRLGALGFYNLRALLPESA